jgi:hypothetical protein
MRSFATQREIDKRIGRQVPPGEEPEPVDVGNPKVRQAIEDLVKERISPEALATAKEEASRREAERAKEAEKAGRKKEKGKVSPDLSRELYTSLLRKVVEAHPVTEAQLLDLGRARAEAIRQELVTTGRVDEGRLIVLEPSAAEGESREGVASGVSLDVKR